MRLACCPPYPPPTPLPFPVPVKTVKYAMKWSVFKPRNTLLKMANAAKRQRPPEVGERRGLDY